MGLLSTIINMYFAAMVNHVHAFYAPEKNTVEK